MKLLVSFNFRNTTELFEYEIINTKTASYSNYISLYILVLLLVILCEHDYDTLSVYVWKKYISNTFFSFFEK
jgi:hypothetical protein